MTSIQKIEIGLNVNVNPRIITTQGDYCPRNHSITLICQHPSLLYNRHGWYLGTVWIGDNHLELIQAEVMSICLQQIKTSLNPYIEGTLDSLGSQLHDKIITLCQELQKHFPEKTFQIQHHYIQVPEISTSFKESIASSNS